MPWEVEVTIAEDGGEPVEVASEVTLTLTHKPKPNPNPNLLLFRMHSFPKDGPFGSITTLCTYYLSAITK
jgi:hypothetical protein